MGSFISNIGRTHAERSVLSLLSDFHECRSGDAYMIIAAIVLIATLFMFRSDASVHKRIPSANVFANIVGFLRDPVDYLSHLVKTKGHIFKVGKVVFVVDCKFSLQIQRGDRAKGIQPVDKPFAAIMPKMMGISDEKMMTFRQTGEEWHPRRKGIASSFSFKSIRELLNISKDFNRKFFEYIDSFGYTKSQQIVNLSKLASEHAACADAALLMDGNYEFGDREGHQKCLLEIKQWFLDMSQRFRDPIYALAYSFSPSKQREHAARTKYLLDFGLEIIDNRRKRYAEQGEPHMPFLIDTVIKAPYPSDKARAVDILEFLSNFAIIITNLGTLLEIGLRPEVQRKVQSELDMVNPERKGFDVEMLDELKYLDRVMDEGMRLHPGGGILSARLTLDELQYEGYILPKGSVVQTPNYQMFRDSRYLKDPDGFNPDRWASDSPELPALTDMKKLFFAEGPRQCPARVLAKYTTKAFVATFLQKYEVEIVDPGTRKFFITLTISDMLVRLKDR